MPTTPTLTRKAILLQSVRFLLSFIRSSVGGKAKLMFTTLVILLVAINGFNVLISYTGRNFMTAIEQKQMGEFLHQAILMIALFSISTIAAAFARFFEERLGLLWRNWLTDKTLQRYMRDRSYQFIEANQSVQHPDQRISEDIRALTTTALSFVLMLLNSFLGIVAFAGVLISISPMLFLVSFLYAMMGSLFTMWLGRPLIALNSRQVDREADFRSELLDVRTHTEPIALLQREGTFLRRLQERLSALVANTKRMIRVNRDLAFFTGIYNYLIQIIPALMVAPFFIKGEAEFGIIAQSALAFTVLVNAFSLVVSQFPAISSFAAVTNRLNALNQATDETRSHQVSNLHISNDTPYIQFEHVTLYSQEEAPPLLLDFNATLVAGQKVLISAKNKLALLRLFNATAGIENHSVGNLHRPSSDQVMFIPEKPYMPPGTLRENLTSANGRHLLDEANILTVLEQLDIGQVVDAAGGLDVPHSDWNTFLSIGEQKLLDIARLLLAKPQFVFLLRLRSVLSDERVERVMQLLKTSGITYINLGKYEFAECYDVIFELLDDGSWSRVEQPPCSPSVA